MTLQTFGPRPIADLQELARRIRVHAVRMTHRARTSHVGATLSMADLLAVLFGGVLRVDPKRPEWPGRDRFVLSKGHACVGLYAALAERGFFPVDQLASFAADGSPLVAHISSLNVPGVDVSTGSLGHGLGIASGMALAGARDGSDFRTFVLLSDGECDEGSTWEAALFAAHHRLDRLIAIVDYNKIQSLGRVSDVLELEPLAEKWRAFGWGVCEIDGHDLAAIDATLRAVPLTVGRPTCVIGHTVKGKGVSFMEDRLAWHYQTPSDEELRRALEELLEPET